MSDIQETAFSQFLPEDFDPARPIAVIAGKAVYPKLTIAAIRDFGIPVRLVAFEEETREDVVESFPESERIVLKVGQLGRMLKALREFGAGYAMMVGQITPKRLFRGLHPDGKALILMAKLKERNAETIFGAIANEVEKIGVKVLDARSFLDKDLAVKGLMTHGTLYADESAIEHGIRIAKEVANLNIGQSVVVRKGTVIAVEAFEGTDKMLRRAGSFRTEGLIFVKTVKPGQDFRFDVPVFGIRTLEVMHEAKISLACLEAGSALILDREFVLEQAREWKIQVYGY